MVKNYMNESYEKKDVVKNGKEKIYYLYHHKKDQWAVYMAGENKIGARAAPIFVLRRRICSNETVFLTPWGHLIYKIMKSVINK